MTAFVKYGSLSGVDFLIAISSTTLNKKGELHLFYPNPLLTLNSKDKCLPVFNLSLYVIIYNFVPNIFPLFVSWLKFDEWSVFLLETLSGTLLLFRLYKVLILHIKYSPEFCTLHIAK